MALVVAGSPAHKRVRTRYQFDMGRLLAFFGGLEHLERSAAVFGVPPPPTVRFTTAHYYVPVLLELAHRMHKPLDLYDYLVEVR